MNLFDAFKNQVENHMSKQRSKKIYVLSRKKSLNNRDNNLKQLIDIDPKLLKKFSLNPIEGSIKRFLDNKRKGNETFALEYPEESKLENLEDKRMQVRKKLSSHFQPANSKVRQKSDNFHERMSQKYDKSINSSQQLRLNRDSNESPNKYNQNNKNHINLNSLPHLSKRLITFSKSYQNSPIRPKNSRNKMGIYSPVNEGYLIHKKNQLSQFKDEQVRRQKTQYKYEDDEVTQILKNSQSEPKSLSDKYYALIRQTDYKKMTNNVGNKHIRNNYIQLKRKRSLQKETLKINQIDSRNLLKAQQIFTMSKKAQLKI